MNNAQKKAFKNRVDSLKKENKKLSEKLAALKKEKQLLQRDLRAAHKLLTEIPGPVILVQGQRIVFANEMAWDLLGFSEEELLSHNALNLVHPKSSEYAKNAFKKLIAGKPIQDQFEVYMCKKNGDPLCCEVNWRKIRYHGRTAFLFNVTGLDQRKLNEKKFSQSQKIQAIARMASWLSRDYNRGFRIISQHFSQFLETNTVTDKAVIRELRRIEAAMEIGQNMSRRLECLTRFENDQAHVSLFDPKKIVRDAVAVTRPHWKENGDAKIEIKTYMRTLSPVQGNPDEMRDAFASMILNAVDAMPNGGEIYLTAEENSGFACIYIQDNGTGIPDEIQDKIFDPFFTTKTGRHAGLGLSLSHAVVGRHGGEIEIISQEGEGTTFIVKLPLSKQPVVAPKAKHVRNRIRDAHILIVSADSIAEDLLVQVFKSKGGKVTVVYSYMEGLKLLKRKIFDLVVAGIDAPGFDLSGMIQRAKQIKNGLPVVLVNAEDNGRPSHKLKALGADLIIERPLEMDSIMFLISETIAVKALLD